MDVSIDWVDEVDWKNLGILKTTSVALVVFFGSVSIERGAQDTEKLQQIIRWNQYKFWWASSMTFQAHPENANWN